MFDSRTSHTMFDPRIRGSATVASAILILGFVASVGAAKAAGTATEYKAEYKDLSSAIAACGKLPRSERTTCKSEAEARYGPELTPAPQPGANEATVAAKQARYKDALAACAKLPLSERTTCTSRAEATYVEPSERLDYPTAASTKRVMADETRRYREALAECAKLPLSERTTCKSNAGLASTLTKGTPAGGG